MIRQRVSWFRREFDLRRRRFLIELDAERVTNFQSIYYPLIVAAGLYCWLVADEKTTALSNTLGQPVFVGWLALNIVCPFLTLIGRRLMRHAAALPPGDPNPSVGGAWLQLVGDGGVWGAIVIYFACFATTFTVGQPLYTTFFFFMGIPGGFLFFYRSWRRLRQITRRAKQMT